MCNNFYNQLSHITCVVHWSRNVLWDTCYIYCQLDTFQLTRATFSSLYCYSKLRTIYTKTLFHRVSADLYIFFYNNAFFTLTMSARLLVEYVNGDTGTRGRGYTTICVYMYYTFSKINRFIAVCIDNIMRTRIFPNRIYRNDV